MVRCGWWLVIFLFQVCHGNRRILNGRNPENDKPYMVYLIKSPDSRSAYDNWLCGGAIVSPHYIVTSAACVEDVQYMYAIAGYIKYVTSFEVDNDPCTGSVKNRVIMTCVPKPYHLDYENASSWTRLDIAVAEVESPYDFSDTTYLEHCTHIPAPIVIDYDTPRESGLESFVLGWGHDKFYRRPQDSTDYNRDTLKSAQVSIADIATCLKAWPTNLHSVMKKYMICSQGPGIEGRRRNVIGCQPAVCERQIRVCYCTYNYRVQRPRHVPLKPRPTPNGFCQNDHGGPLVGLIDGQEVLLGIQSSFLVDEDYTCAGPFLYTNVAMFRNFIECIINFKSIHASGNETNLRTPDCDLDSTEDGFTMKTHRPVWVDVGSR